MNRQHEVWIVDDDKAIRWVLERALEKEHIATRSFDTADKVVTRLRKFEPDVIITAIRMPGRMVCACWSTFRVNILTCP